ncbi:Morn repeat domain containing protein [Pandoravirus neocaledonia]|uniref:Morn repeat domain containing protein n=1 Tax=Pandoravirus neocaledonia TaxID=2107708 RepID=A0A2U7UCF9_9VIRU|nr:Morn repeat domain containing protein [Pandoravirus neocaledonia]AVK76082.1 Morn repeat domain containing protein [Pandoravirus neocaledonia]
MKRPCGRLAPARPTETLGSAQLATVKNDNATESRSKRKATRTRSKYDAPNGFWSFFDLLPNELAIEVLVATEDIQSVVRWSCTSRRHHSLGGDPVLWRRMYESRFGSPRHADFAKRGKDWRWLYRARACNGSAFKVAVGEVPFALGRALGLYWGDLVNGIPHGYGLITAALGGTDECYEGDFCKGKFNGHGVRVWSDGHRYEGNFVDGEKHGHGVYMWPNGQRYEGDWKGGSKHGHGVLTHADGSRYEGDWKGDKRHGHGTQTLADGERYEGDHVRNMAHGRGVRTFPDGWRYEGDFVNGWYHGYGVLTSKDGHQERGQWRRGELL